MKRLLVFTDLDGTLLDHNNYQWQAAAAAIEWLHEHDCPLIFNSSKTYAEMQPLATQMNNHAPMICENGSSIALPQNYFQHDNGIIYFGERYDTIIDVLNELRQQYRYKFVGFNDMSIDEIVAHTGLDERQAALAQQRLSSEPLKWMDTDEALREFTLHLQQRQLSIKKGGRFYSVSGRCSKGDAVHWLVERYRQEQPDTQWLTVALGDSDNDLPMLECVDYPVLISNPYSSSPASINLENVTRPDKPGPEGWNIAIHQMQGLIL
jgi:mannosyl-3-phosphoglycerate phosphatase